MSMPRKAILAEMGLSPVWVRRDGDPPVARRIGEEAEAPLPAAQEPVRNSVCEA